MNTSLMTGIIPVMSLYAATWFIQMLTFAYKYLFLMLFVLMMMTIIIFREEIYDQNSILFDIATVVLMPLSYGLGLLQGIKITYRKMKR